MDLQASILSQIEGITMRVKTQGLTDTARQVLLEHQYTLQKMYDDVLAKGNLLSPEEKLRIQTELESLKQKELAADAAKDKKRILIFGVVSAVLVIAGIWLYQKHSK